MLAKYIYFPLFAVLLLANVLSGYSQENVTVDLGAMDNLSEEQSRKIASAFAAMDAVQQANRYVASLSDLLSDGELSLPVGIKRGDYELVVQKIYLDKTGKPRIYATCAFRFKDTGQKVAFEGETVLESVSGLGGVGKLNLIAPVRRDIGKESVLVVREGTGAAFGCEGVESFDAKLSWMVTSDKIIPLDNQGNPNNQPLCVHFETQFDNFDSYLVSLDVNRSFAIQGLDGFFFTLKGATLDQSDTETSPMTRFPESYFRQGGDAALKLWKGLAVSEASVSLPTFFKKPSSGGDERITLSLRQVIFDENGFSGNSSAENIIPSENLKPGLWGISLTGFSVGILKNGIVAFGLSGDVNMPPFGNHSRLPYTAVINPAINEYEFKVNIAGKYDFPVLKSTVSLNELSTVDFLFKEAEIYPAIHASGTLSINAPLGKDSTKTFDVPDIAFENMVIRRESPYFEVGAIGITGNLKSPKIAGFELSVNNIHTFKDGKGSGLAFEAGISLNDMFGGNAGMQLYGDYERWKFREVAVDKIRVEYTSGAFGISGGVWLKNSDPVYGDGFRGDIRLSLLDKFTFDAVGVFGKKDAYRYFLTDVFFETSPSSGITIPPMLTFYGFGGGLYRRMQQASKMPSQVAGSADLEFGKSLSGISYLPDEKVGLGVMASTKFALTGSSNAFNAKVGFEMQFNNHGGLNFVQLRGDAAFVDMPEKWGTLSDNVSSRMEKLEKSGATQPEKTKKSDLEAAPENKSSGFLSASMNIEYDLINKTFSADLNAYLNAGIIRGIGPNDRMGWASAYFAPDAWHVYMGTPNDRLGVKVLNLAELNGYFMLGNGIPALPLPPPGVLNLLSADKQARLKRGNSDKLMMGKGIAFGAAFGLNFDARLTPFYAHFGVGLGTEFILTNLNGATCANYSGVPGINGWFAQAQAWAFVEADIGMMVKVFGKNRSFSIMDLSVGTLLEGSGPNPIYFAGAVGGRYNVLGGLVKGNCSFDFEIGEKCIVEGGSPFGEDVIAQLTPGTGAKDVNVFAAPQAIFNIPVNVPMAIEEDNIKGTYMVVLEDFSIKYKDNGKTTSGRSKYSEDGTVYLLTPEDPFESQKEVEVSAKVVFKKKVNNSWEYVNGNDGKPASEIKTVTFRTGDRPKEILPEHVKYSYPISRQYNFYADEYKQGYLQLTQNYAYLFSTDKPEGFDQKIRLSDDNGKVSDIPFSYTANAPGSDVRMEISFSMEQARLDKDKIYKLAILNIPQQANADIKSNISATTTDAGNGMEVTRQQATEALTQLSEKEIYALHFRTSRYRTFAEKIKTFEKPSEGWRDYVEPFVHHIKTNLREPERFDAYEVNGTNGTDKLIRFAAQVNKTDWYTQTLYKGMYESQSRFSVPVQAVSIYSGDDNKLLTDDEITSGQASGFGEQGIFCYALPYSCFRDFVAVKESIARRTLYGQITPQEASLLSTDFPPVVLQGDYPVAVSYVLPGQNIVSSTVEIAMYNPVTP
jgi:hypothetical protein